jgi:hypothetical protein
MAGSVLKHARELNVSLSGSEPSANPVISLRLHDPFTLLFEESSDVSVAGSESKNSIEFNVSLSGDELVANPVRSTEPIGRSTLMFGESAANTGNIELPTIPKITSIDTS